MTGSEQVQRAARRAIARAKARGDEEVTPDDLLAGALAEVSRFGIAWIGDWALEVRELGNGAAGARGEEADDRSPDTTYGAAAVELFERAAALAREDGAAGMGLVHLLVAFTEGECELLAELGERHGFTTSEWRAALARGVVGVPPHVPTGGAGAQADGTPSRPDILSVEEAAEMLNVHSQTVRNYIRDGKLPAYRLAGERYIRILRRDLLALLERVPTDTADETEENIP